MKRFISCIVMLFVVTITFAGPYTFTASIMAKGYNVNGEYVNPKITRGNWVITLGDTDLYIKGGPYYGEKIYQTLQKCI